jgi:hypothetical protein
MIKMTRKVFITQEVSTVNYSLAIGWGDLVFVTAQKDRLSPHSKSVNNAQLLDHMAKVLSTFTEDDYLICTGAPAHMAIAGAMLGPRLKHLLVWDNRENAYFEVNL